MAIFFGIRNWYSEFLEYGCVHITLWLLKNLHHSIAQQNLVTNDLNISGKNFGFYFSHSQIMLGCDNSYIFFYYY